MSDYYLPLEIQEEIMKRLPVKSLVEFRFVSKTWKCLIESPDFIAAYSRQQHSQQVQYLLVNYGDFDLGYETYLDEHNKYVSIVDDDTFPQQKVYLTLPPLVERLTDCRTISSSQGLLCLYGCYHEGTTKEVVVLWNISIRKAITVVLRNLTEGIYGIVLGFGVCRETTEPKIVKITHVDHKRTTTYQVEVFALRTRAWRSPYGNNLPRKSINFYSYIYGEVLINGVFYWLATDRNTMDDEYTLIVSFDMTSEEFGEITLPDTIAHPSDNALSLSNFKESLVVLEYDEWEMADCVVWMMGDGVSKSFTKLFTFTPNEMALVTGFRKSGEPIIILPTGYDSGQLAGYNPYSKHIDNLGMHGRLSSFSVYPYMETLLLLDQPNIMEALH